MATTDQISSLRTLVNDEAAPQTFTAPQLSAYIDAAGGDVRLAAGSVWAVKASKLAGLVDVTEGTSSRKLGSLYKQALEMATYYGGSTAAAEVTTTRRSGTRAITRPVA